MKHENLVTITLKDYEDLKKFKDNAHKQNFVSVTDGSIWKKPYRYDFFSNEEMNKKLMDKIAQLENENDNLRNENIVLKNDFENLELDYKL